jgi:hypothetical protein
LLVDAATYIKNNFNRQMKGFIKGGGGREKKNGHLKKIDHPLLTQIDE